MRRYLGRISRPLLDRIDICAEAAPVTYRDIRTEQNNESSADMRDRIVRARQIQKLRYEGSGIYTNSEMGIRQIRHFCSLREDDEAFLQQIFSRLGLSARGCHKILKVARTLADLEGKERIDRTHLREAAGYRDLQERYWGKEVADDVPN